MMDKRLSVDRIEELARYLCDCAAKNFALTLWANLGDNDRIMWRVLAQAAFDFLSEEHKTRLTESGS